MRILLLGSTGMVGRVLKKKLEKKNYKLKSPSRKKLNLLEKKNICDYLKKNKFDIVINVAGKVGGIMDNMNNQEKYLLENSIINLNLISECFNSGIKNFINLGSSCIYPKNFSRKINESDLFSGPLEPTNEGYAIAKLSALKLCEYYSKKYKVNFKTLIPCNLYGPHDNFSEKDGHLIGSVIKKMYFAKLKKQKIVEIWGSGNARREFMYVEDLANAIIFFIKKISEIPLFLNVGLGKDYKIKKYYKVIASSMNYYPKFIYNKSKPEGMKRKLVNTKIQNKFGWRPKFTLEKGIKKTIKYFINEKK